MNFKKRDSLTTIKDVVMRNLGVTSSLDVKKWFERTASNAYTIEGLDIVSMMIRQYQWDTVFVVGDYDADGITATAIMVMTLDALNIPVKYRIPHRMSEGFGLNERIIDEVPEGKTLLITVDNGISAIDAINKAVDKGITVIVTDHHLPTMIDGEAVFPAADMIIDPNAVEGQAYYNGYCGAGLSYKICCKLIADEISDHPNRKSELMALQNRLLPLFTIGTICDVMQLREENYVLVRAGLGLMDKRCATAGVLSLMDKLWVTHPTAEDIAFKIGPAINANGRLFDDGATTSVELLRCMEFEDADSLADVTVAHNNLRKQLVDVATKKAHQMIEEQLLSEALPLCLYIPSLNEGIVGIIAGKLSEEYGTLAIVLTDCESNKGWLKGSARSIEGISVKDLLDENQDDFVHYGGHNGAAGLTITREDFQKMVFDLTDTCRAHEYQRSPFNDTVFYDLEIEEHEIPETVKEVVRFGPFGEGNRAPIFKIKDYALQLMPSGMYKQRVGSGSTIKLQGNHSQAIGFDCAEGILADSKNTFDLYGTLSYNYFKGSVTPQVSFESFS